MRPKLPKPTKGDQSSAAATGQKKKTAITALDIAYATPASGNPDTPIGVGDQLFSSTVSELLAGGVEYTIIPTEDPNDAYRVFKLSPQLSPIVAAFAANVYGAGHSFDPVLESDRPDAYERVRKALVFSKAISAGSFEHTATIADSAIQTEIDRIANRIANESQYLRAWFARACPKSTYQELMILVGQDIEVQGDGYIEVLRDAKGYPSKMVWAPAWSIRAKPLDEELIPTQIPIPITDFVWGTETQYLMFRSYVQINLNGQIIARYKEYGDPRCMSRRTGKYYPTFEDMLANRDEEWTTDNDDNPYAPQAATELLHFHLSNPLSSAYGKPEYTGIYPNLDGARDLEEENRTLIVDRKVPQMFILVSGGAGIPQKEIEALESRIMKNNAEGKKSIYILQARSAKTATGMLSPTPTLEIVKTKSEQYQDALGLQYLEHSEQQARHAYRLPRAALGQHDNITKDEALSAYRFVEAQVYGPRRDMMDDRINSTLLRDLGVQLVKYKTCARTPKEPNELASIINTMMTAGVLTPDEGRALASDIFNKEFKDLEGIWSKLPTKLLLAMLQTKNQLVAAALLGSESESDIIERLQSALMGQVPGNTNSSDAPMFTDGNPNGSGTTNTTAAGVPSANAGVSPAGSAGKISMPLLPEGQTTP